MVKEAREHVERAYKISLDLGKFAKAVAEEELKGVKSEVSIDEPKSHVG